MSSAPYTYLREIRFVPMQGESFVPLPPTRSLSAPLPQKPILKRSETPLEKKLQRVQFVIPELEIRSSSAPPQIKSKWPSILKKPSEPASSKKRKNSNFIIEEYFPRLAPKRQTIAPSDASKSFVSRCKKLVMAYEASPGEKKWILDHKKFSMMVPLPYASQCFFDQYTLVDKQDFEKDVPNSRFTIKIPKCVGDSRLVFDQFSKYILQEQQLREFVAAHSYDIQFSDIIDLEQTQSAGFIKKYEAGLPIDNSEMAIQDINTLLALAVDPEFRKLGIIIEFTRDSGLLRMHPQKQTSAIYWGDVICEDPNEKDQIAVIERCLRAFLTSPVINVSHFKQLTSGMAQKDPFLIPLLAKWESAF